MADIKIFGTLHNVTGEALARANEIYDDNKTQSEINEEIAEGLDNRYTKDETYSQAELESMITPPEPEYISVSTYAELQTLTTHPNGAIYRVAHYDGTQVDNTKFAEYSWTGSEYKLLAVRGNALEPIVGYYECTTAAATAAKTITASNYILTVGGSIKIKMTNINTSDNATLNINSTGAKALYYAGERASANNTWEAGETVEVYYDGTSYYANNVAGGSGSGDGAFDVSAKTGQSYNTLTAALTAANSILTTNQKKGGMSLKYTTPIPATYVVVKIDGVTTQPTGTELQNAPSIDSGIYTADKLDAFATLPTSTAVIYYVAITVDETTTYTTWVITLKTSESSKYIQARLMAVSWSTIATDWQIVDDEIADNNNLISNAGVYKLKDELLIGTQFETITDEAFVNNGNMYNTGMINSSNINYRNTDLIPVKTGDVVTIDYSLYDTYQYGAFEAVCLYGLNVAGYLSKSSFADAPKPVLTVTQDGYVRFCKKATDTAGSAIHIYHNGGELNEINEKLNELTYTGDANIQLKEDDFKYVGALLSNGTIYTSNKSCICTDLIEVGQNKNIVTNIYAQYGLITWVQYAEDGVTAVANSGNVTSASLRTITMNSTAKYIRFCWEYKGSNKKPFPVVNYIGSVVSEINNIKSKITTLETKHNLEYYSKDFELEDRGGGYINNNTGSAEFSKTGYASPWIPLRKGTYKIKTESNCYVTVFRHVIYQKDYTTNGSINSITTTANVESTLVLSEAGFMRVSPVGSVTTGAEGIHIEQFGELEGDLPVLPTWDKLHISGFDNSNIRLYIPTGSGVFEIVNLKHYTSGGFAYMMEHWGIEMCYLSTNANDKTIVADYPITRASEYEQAIDIVSDTHNGYIGGHMHGYEQMDSIQIKVDGVTRNDYHFRDDCEQVEIIQYSTLYETDKSTEIAKVTKRWVFDNKKFDTFINTIFSKEVTINRCMTAMFGILRRLEPETQGGERGAYLTNKGMKDTSWQIVSTTDGWDNPSTYTDGAQMLMAGNNEATHLEQWGDLGYKTVLEVPKASRLTGAGMLIETNGGTYNKMYYDCGSGQMNIGDYIFSHAIFKFGRFLV